MRSGLPALRRLRHSALPLLLFGCSCDGDPAVPEAPAFSIHEVRDTGFLARRAYTLRPPDPATGLPRFGPVSEVRVWVDDYRAELGGGGVETPGVAYLSLEPGDTSAVRAGGRWTPLQPLDFTVDETHGILHLTDPVAELHSLAASFVARPEGVPTGGLAGDSLRLQMLHPSDLLTWYGQGGGSSTPWSPLMGAEMRNIYDLGGADFPTSGYLIEVRVLTPEWEWVDRQDGMPLIELLGLDRGTYTVSEADPDTPDGVVDPHWIDFSAGRLFFPNVRPFDPVPGSPFSTDYDLGVRNEILYRLPERRVRFDPDAHRYQIRVAHARS